MGLSVYSVCAADFVFGRGTGANIPVEQCNGLSVSLLLENSSCAATVPSINLGLISLVQRPSASLV